MINKQYISFDKKKLFLKCFKYCIILINLKISTLATKDHRELNLSSLRMLSVADGANPWSLSSCDQFLSVFQVSFYFYSIDFMDN